MPNTRTEISAPVSQLDKVAAEIPDPVLGVDREWLDFEESLGERPVLSGDIVSIRTQLAGLGSMVIAMRPSIYTNLSTEDTSTDDGIGLRVYKPVVAGTSPLCIFFHGGGFCTGSLDSEDFVCRMICEKTSSIVVSIEYRLAPEFPAPTSFDDSVSGAIWAIRNAQALGADISKIYIFGSSAGGTLALGVFLKLYDMGYKDVIRGIICISPTLFKTDEIPAKYRPQHKSCVRGLPMIDSEAMRTFYREYSVPSTDKYHFLVDNANLSVLPPIFIAATEIDPLRDDTLILKETFDAAGVKYKFELYKGLPHIFWFIPLKNASALFENSVIGAVDFVLAV
ncbi:lipase/esterase-like protein [Lipomyces starkeyi]